MIFCKYPQIKQIISQIVTVLLWSLISSCYREDRIKPLQPTSNANSPTVAQPPKLKDIAYNANFYNKIDSNSNNYFAAAKLDLKLEFNNTGKVRYKIYARYSDASEFLLFASEVHELSNNLVLPIELDIVSDSIFKFLPSDLLSAKFNITIRVEDQYGSLLSNTSSYLTTYSIGNLDLERSKADVKYLFNVSNILPNIGEDKNNDGYYTQFESIKFILDAQNKVRTKCIIVIYYYDIFGQLKEYARSDNFEVSGENTNGYEVVLNNIQVGDLYGLRNLYLGVYDSRTKTIICQNAFQYNFDTEYKDSRSYEMEYVKVESKDDLNKNSFPSTYAITFKINGTDSTIKEVNLTFNYFTVFGNIHSVLYNQVKIGTEQKIIISSFGNLSRGYYDLKLNLYDGSMNKEWNKQNFPILGDIKFETVTEDN